MKRTLQCGRRRPRQVRKKFHAITRENRAPTRQARAVWSCYTASLRPYQFCATTDNTIQRSLAITVREVRWRPGTSRATQSSKNSLSQSESFTPPRFFFLPVTDPFLLFLWRKSAAPLSHVPETRKEKKKEGTQDGVCIRSMHFIKPTIEGDGDATAKRTRLPGRVVISVLRAAVVRVLYAPRWSP